MASNLQSGRGVSLILKSARASVLFERLFNYRANWRKMTASGFRKSRLMRLDHPALKGAAFRARN